LIVQKKVTLEKYLSLSGSVSDGTTLGSSPVAFFGTSGLEQWWFEHDVIK
jgi:hypothetical protein